MFSKIIQITIVSVIFILVVDNIYQFLKDSLTIPKKHDLIYAPNEKYKQMLDIINMSGRSFQETSGHTQSATADNSHGVNAAPHSMQGATSIHDIPMVAQSADHVSTHGNSILSSSKLAPENAENMKTELKNFMKQQLSGATKQALPSPGSHQFSN